MNTDEDDNFPTVPNRDLQQHLAKLADYLVLASQLKVNASPKEYHLANALSFELAMVLPAELYRSIGRALSTPSNKHNVMSVVVEARRLAMGIPMAGNLTANDVIGHAPGAGRKD